MASFAIPGFPKPENLLNIVVASSFMGCLVLAQSFVLISGHFDLATEANMIFSAIVGTVIMIAPAYTQIQGETLRGGGLGLLHSVFDFSSAVISSVISHSG
jgi:ribose/xylose/arabinose/galactoside ABC-type transport system permease subunit